MVASAVDSALRYRRASWQSRVRSHPAGPVTILFVVMLAGCIVASLLLPEQFRFLLPGNLSLVLRQIPNLGLVALGVGILMIAGEFDLSVGSVFVAAPFATAVAYDAGVPFALAVLIAIAIAVVIGLINAGITLGFRIPSFITTLGMLFIVRTAAPYIVDLYGGRKSLPFRPPEGFKEVLTVDVFGFLPAQFIWFLLFAVLAYLLLNRHFLGNHFFAAGGDPKAAQFAGINVNRTKTVAFVLSSVFATISGIFTITRVAVAQTNPQLFIELYAVAICVIGGLSLFGGRGSVLGIVIGACVLQLVQDIILLAQLPGFYLDMFVGLMIVAGVVINQAIKRKY
jgi:simple sugar transport system permease protein